jgi:uncharacterized protein YegP (UPF0339 family)
MVHVFKSATGRWHFYIFGSNGKPLASSIKGYTKSCSCRRAVKRLKRAIG